MPENPLPCFNCKLGSLYSGFPQCHPKPENTAGDRLRASSSLWNCQAALTAAGCPRGTAERGREPGAISSLLDKGDAWFVLQASCFSSGLARNSFTTCLGVQGRNLGTKGPPSFPSATLVAGAWTLQDGGRGCWPPSQLYRGFLCTCC